MSDELKPCPFCGFHEPIFREGCVGCRNSGCVGVFHFIPDRDWQNAYCWKQIDRLEAEKRELVEALSKGCPHFCTDGYCPFDRRFKDLIAKHSETKGAERER